MCSAKDEGSGEWKPSKAGSSGSGWSKYIGRNFGNTGSDILLV